MEHGEPLPGGLANAGSVLRRGDVVVRPAPAHAAAIHAFLRRLRRQGFDGAPVPRRLTGGWEELEYIAGEVAVVPYPPWSLTDDALASVAGLLRRFHDAAGQVPVDAAVRWPRDLAMTARYWVPVLDPRSAEVSGRAHLDPVRRLRLLADAYGLAAEERTGFLAVLESTVEVARGFVAARVAAGERAFVQAHHEHGGWERWDRLQAWLAASRDRFTEALCEGR